MLNREGTIQVLDRFDGQASTWEPTSWEDYMRSDPKRFLLELERAAGLAPATSIPPSAIDTLVYRLLATFAALSCKSVDPMRIEQGFIDTAGYGSGVNASISDFPGLESRISRDCQAGGGGAHPGFRYWMTWRKGKPLVAINRETGKIWTSNGKWPITLDRMYAAAGRDVERLALEILSRG